MHALTAGLLGRQVAKWGAALSPSLFVLLCFTKARKPYRWSGTILGELHPQQRGQHGRGRASHQRRLSSRRGRSSAAPSAPDGKSSATKSFPVSHAPFAGMGKAVERSLVANESREAGKWLCSLSPLYAEVPRLQSYPLCCHRRRRTVIESCRNPRGGAQAVRWLPESSAMTRPLTLTPIG
jgi:hypothetical protein